MSTRILPGCQVPERDQGPHQEERVGKNWPEINWHKESKQCHLVRQAKLKEYPKFKLFFRN